MEMGISESEIEPRVNVLTFQAWRALGRTVKRGEHGVKVHTWVPIAEQRDDDDSVIKPAGRMPKTTTVFHITQTKALDA